MDPQLLKGSVAIMLLALLDEEPQHGYQLAERLRERSRGKYALGEATLYQTLHRLEAAGLVRSEWERATGKRERRTYRIVDAGRAHLALKRKEWKDFVGLVQAVIAPGR